MYIEVFEREQIEKGIRTFNKIIELEGKVEVGFLNLISFWEGPFAIGEIENPDVERALRWIKKEDSKYLNNFGWTEKIEHYDCQEINLDEKTSKVFNRVYAYRLYLPNVKEL